MINYCSRNSTPNILKTNLCVYRGAQFEFEIQFEFREKNIVCLPTNCVKTVLT